MQFGQRCAERIPLHVAAERINIAHRLAAVGVAATDRLVCLAAITIGQFARTETGVAQIGRLCGTQFIPSLRTAEWVLCAYDIATYALIAAR